MDRLLARLEPRLGRFAVRGLTWYLVIGQVALFVMIALHANPTFITSLLFQPSLILQGQVWRAFAFLVIAADYRPMWFVLSAYFLYFIGTALERDWGTFKYNVFWLSGWALTFAAGMAAGMLSPYGDMAVATTSVLFLELSLYLAYATVFPDAQMMLFFVLPVKAWWLGMLDLAFLGYYTWGAPGIAKLVPLAALANYLLFFGRDVWRLVRNEQARTRHVAKFGQEFRGPRPSALRAVRTCHLCGVTSEDPDVEFRVCTCEKCGGKPTDFCLPHARNH